MPSEFALPLGELIARVPQHCVWPGRHDTDRVLRIPSADVASGLARGKAQLSLARLVALAPDVFRWERGESDDPQVRLPIQKLLRQICNEDAVPPSTHERRGAARMPPAHEKTNAGDSPGEAKILAGQLPSIRWELPEARAMPPTPGAATNAAGKEHAPADSAAPTEPEMPALAVKPQFGTPNVRPTISVTATEPPDRPVQLRPSKDVSISTTLRAVILGGIAPAASANAPAPAVQILAPRVTPALPVTPPPVILGPSVVPSANDGGRAARRAAPDFAGLQNLFMTDAALDLAGVAALAATLPGVRACVISGAAGSATAGDFSYDVSTEEVRAASACLARIGGSATDTLHHRESDIALFLHDEVCVAAVIATGGFVPGVRERLAQVAELLAGTAAVQ